MHLTLTPAYGRDYKSKKEVIADFDANKDFVDMSYGAPGGQYVNKEQIEKGTTVALRYKRHTMVVMVKV